MATVRKLTTDEVNKHWSDEHVAQAQPAVAQPANYMIVWVDVTVPQPAPWNPPVRTTKRATASLVKRIQEEGFEAFRPILLSKDGFIGDGHRRWTAAKQLGMTKVPVIYTDKTVEELWAGNLGMRAPGSKEWMEVNILGGVKGIPDRAAENIESLLMIFGDEGVRFLIERGQSPEIWRRIWRAGQYCKRTDNAFLRKCGYWMLKHKMAEKTMRAIAPSTYGDDPIDPRVLIQAIESDVPLRSSWGFSE